VRFDFIDAEKARYPIPILCRLLRVSRSGYYASRVRQPSQRSLDDQHLARRITMIHRDSRRSYGSPRIHDELCKQGVRTSRKRVARLMRMQSLFVRRRKRFRVTTDSAHTLPVAENLLARDFTAEAPNTAWVGDITYLWTREGWLYVAVLLDLFSRRIVGLAMDERLDTGLCLAALCEAVGVRRPGPGLIHHSDRGSQYASHAYRRELARHGMRCSMSRKANCWDNAVAESFFSTLKTELVAGRIYATRSEARRAVFEWVEVFYNGKRSHSTLGYRTPMEYERLYTTASPAA